VNVLRQRSSFMIVMRVIPFTVPTIEALKLPDAVRGIAESDRGLVIVAGVSGSGKSSTVAAMVHHINRTQHKHVVTIENPIEFLHRDLNCSITQREVGVDTETFSVGLRAALRQDPDVVVIGEMTDAETIDTAIKAAETGHLVIASLSTADATGTVERIIATLPHEEREVGRMRFAEALRAIVAQRLLPRTDEDGRVAAIEILVATPEVRASLKDPARLGALRELMAKGAEQGMRTFEQSVGELRREDRISAETAEAASMLATLAPAAAAAPASAPPSRKGSRTAAS
jgi:twitching motility protein PilT